MTTEIQLARIRQYQDGRVMLVDAKGEDLARVVPFDASNSMERAGYDTDSSDNYFKDVYQAMLSAARVDVSSAVVELPAKRGALEDDHDFDQNKGFDAAIDAMRALIEVKK